jgi:hypothetical protein
MPRRSSFFRSWRSLTHEEYPRPGQAWRARLAIADRMVEITRECAEHDREENRYTALLEALRVAT